MNEIIISEGCFGQDVTIDGESLFIHEYDNRDPKMIEDLQDKLLNKLTELKQGLGMNDWAEIAKWVVQLSGEYEYNTERSDDGDSCNQCGNYNWTEVYEKKN